MKTICIMCPMGCPLEIEQTETDIIITGNNCKRGIDYGKQEFVSPKRMVTSLIEVDEDRVIPVKTSDLIDKKMIFEVLETLKGIKIQLPINVGDVIIKNAAGSGADIVATASMQE